MHNDVTTETFKAVATELCRRVGLPYPPPDALKYNVDDAEWTEAEESDFKEWLINYLGTIPLYKRTGMKRVKKEVDWFMFNYSWKTRNKRGDNL